MIRFATAIALLAAASTASAAEMSVPVTSFDRIELGGSPDVSVVTGKAVSVHANGDRKALDRLDIRVEGGTLRIGTKRGWDWGWGSSTGRVHIAVTVPMVRSVSLGGSGSITVDRVKVAAFGADVGGSGSIKIAALDAAKSDFSVGGSGSIAAAGLCGNGHASIGGSGSMQLGNLKCATLDASVGGSGSLDAFASQTATVSIAGSGDVHVAGGAKCSISKAGSGKARCTA